MEGLKQVIYSEGSRLHVAGHCRQGGRGVCRGPARGDRRSYGAVEKLERCKAYDLRHAWALLARETTTWPTSLKAQAMGHSEAVHPRSYLVEERAEHRRQGLLQLVAQAEGHNGAPTAITPEILALARQLASMQG